MENSMPFEELFNNTKCKIKCGKYSFCEPLGVAIQFYKCEGSGVLRVKLNTLHTSLSTLQALSLRTHSTLIQGNTFTGVVRQTAVPSPS